MATYTILPNPAAALLPWLVSFFVNVLSLAQARSVAIGTLIIAFAGVPIDRHIASIFMAFCCLYGH